MSLDGAKRVIVELISIDFVYDVGVCFHLLLLLLLQLHITQRHAAAINNKNTISICIFIQEQKSAPILFVKDVQRTWNLFADEWFDMYICF